MFSGKHPISFDHIKCCSIFTDFARNLRDPIRYVVSLKHFFLSPGGADGTLRTPLKHSDLEGAWSHGKSRNKTVYCTEFKVKGV